MGCLNPGTDGGPAEQLPNVRGATGGAPQSCLRGALLPVFLLDFSSVTPPTKPPECLLLCATELALPELLRTHPPGLVSGRGPLRGVPPPPPFSHGAKYFLSAGGTSLGTQGLDSMVFRELKLVTRRPHLVHQATLASLTISCPCLSKAACPILSSWLAEYSGFGLATLALGLGLTLTPAAALLAETSP